MVGRKFGSAQAVRNDPSLNKDGRHFPVQTEVVWTCGCARPATAVMGSTDHLCLHCHQRSLRSFGTLSLVSVA